MQIFREPLLITQYSQNLKKTGKTIGFVPTMGALHDGHVSLVKESQKKCDKTVVSIFVNPIQFGKNEDFNKYPRPEAQDVKILENLGVDALFYPNAKSIYPSGFSMYIEPGTMGSKLCGKYRKNHFKGVCTIVAKLFNITFCDYAFFGKKDAQQYLIIKKMVEDFNMPVKIIGIQTHRENDGLAMSSRNTYLTKTEREVAPIIHKSLKRAFETISNGETSAKKIIAIIKTTAQHPILEPQYIGIVNINNLKHSKTVCQNSLVAVAFYCTESNTRLIDNFFVEDGI